MAISDELKRVYVSVGDSVVLHTLEINHPSWEEPVYMVQSYTDFTAYLEGGSVEVTFLKSAFTIQGPDKTEDGAVGFNINLDAVSREVVRLLELASQDLSRVPISVVYRVYLSDDQQGPQNDPPLRMFLKGVQVNNQVASGRAEIMGLTNRKFLNVVYGPEFKNLLYNI